MIRGDGYNVLFNEGHVAQSANPAQAIRASLMKLNRPMYNRGLFALHIGAEENRCAEDAWKAATSLRY